MLLVRNPGSSIAHADAHFPSRLDNVVLRVDSLELTKHFCNGHSHNVRRLKRDHLSPFFILNCAYSSRPEPRSKQPIITGRHSTTLKMSENQRPAFLARSLMNLRR